jgi:ABC-type transport system involved in multi-copper enzyme maturation permease subunit
MLGASTILLILSIVSVRRVGLRQAAGQTSVSSFWTERRSHGIRRGTKVSPALDAGKIRRIKGPPVIWKEMATAFDKRLRPSRIITSSIQGIALLAIYGAFAYAGRLADKEVQTGFVVAYIFLGLLRTSTVAATSITSERDSRTWSLLLVSGLEEKQIVFGKIVGSFLHCRFNWLLLGAHILFFTLARCIHPVAVLPLLMLVVSSALLVSAGGVMVISACRRNSIAAAMNLVLFLWCTIPISFPLPNAFASPVLLAGTILNITGGASAAEMPFYRLEYMTHTGTQGFVISILGLSGVMIIYLLLTFVCYAIANINVHRRVL